jgi:putative SOS response-associated peptidase YedK
MCGRFLLLSSGDEIARLFGLAAAQAVAPRYNVAPSQAAPAVAVDKAGKRQLGLLRWGLVPRWASDPKKAPINARAETVAEKPFFADCLRYRRCLVPASGFYEWMRQGKHKQPFCFRLRDDKPFAFAGLWDVWGSPPGALATFCILTTEANELVRPVHDRMPVIVPEGRYDLWLSRTVQEPADLAPVLRPYPADAMHAFPVGPAVNDPRHDGPECVQPGV